MTDEMMLSSIKNMVSTMMDEKFNSFRNTLSTMMDEKFKVELAPIRNELKELKADVAVLKEDVAVLKEDVAVLKEDVAVLKEDVQVLKSEMIEVKSDQKNMRGMIDDMNERLYVVEEKVLAISLDIENEVKPNLRILAENYVPAAKRYEEETDNIRVLQSDVKLLKSIVGQHSIRLDALNKRERTAY